MCFPVVSEKIMSQHRLAFRIESRKEIEPGVTEQHPVKKADIEGFKENINNALGTNVFSIFDSFGKLGSSTTKKATSGTTTGKTTTIDMSDFSDLYSRAFKKALFIQSIASKASPF